MKKHLLRAITIFALVAFSGCNRKSYTYKEIETGYRGSARFNPFLATERLLEQNNYSVKRERGRAALPRRQTTLVLPAKSMPTGGVPRYRSWIENGGHLIYLVSGYRNRQWEGDTDIWTIIADHTTEHPLLDDFGITVEEEMPAGPESVRLGARNLLVDMSSNIQLSLGDGAPLADVELESEGGTRLLSMTVGSGRLTVMASADPIRNRYLENNDHGRLILGLAQIHPTQSFIFVFGKGTTFFAMLRHHAWMPLLGLVVLIALWIWKNLPRFGPMIPHSDSGDRQFTEHIEMTGRFLWRHKASDALLAPLAAYIHRNIRKRHPHLSDSADEHIEYFLENTDLSRQEISDALLGAPVKDPTTMTRTIKNLKTMIEAL